MTGRVDPAAAADVADLHRKYFVDYSRELGAGTGTVVRQCVDRRTGARRAVKTVSKCRARQVRNLRNEVALLHELDHPRVLGLVDVFEDENYLHAVTELCRGGPVLRRVVKDSRRAAPANEREVASILRQLTEAISYCHAKDIVHRDLKLENILFTTKKRDEIKLIDFDIAVRHGEGDPPLSQKAGTNHYLSPEVIAGQYDKRCDVWAIGVIAYALLAGRFPFRDGTTATQAVAWPAGRAVSAGAQHFVARALRKDPAERATLRELERHAWLQETLESGRSSESTTDKSNKRKMTALRSHCYAFLSRFKSVSQHSFLEHRSTSSCSVN